jgi:hypothetical protein
MSLLSQTLVLYLVVGAGVAGAVYLSDVGRPAERWFRVATALPFWPLYVPILLARAGTFEEAESPTTMANPKDGMAAAIGQVDAELEAALGSLDGWAEGVLARERDRIHELRSAWTAQAERVREMDRLLALPEYADPEEPLPLQPVAVGVGDRLRNSRQARRQNMERLRRVRQRAHEDLLGTLAWVRELVSMIHLAKFTGAPASRAEELVAQIAAAVEGLSELTWQEEPSAPAGGNT